MRLARWTASAAVAATLAIAAVPSAAAERFFLVRLPDRSIVTAQIDVDSDRPIERVSGLPGVALAEVDGPVLGIELVVVEPSEASRSAPPSTAREPARHGAHAPRSHPQDRARSSTRARSRGGRARRSRRGSSRRRSRGRTKPDTRFFDDLPGPSRDMSAFAVNRYRIPIFLLPIYRAAGARYGVRWSVLAAINEIETDYGRNVNVSSAGAIGWMQFMPATWRTYGVDANRDGRSDPYSPVDAIFAAARYLAAAGYAHDVRGAIFAYNRAAWYVESVLLRARLIAGIARGLGDSLSGLTEGRFPVSARTTYIRDLSRGRAAPRGSIELFARRGAPVVAVTDGVVRQLGYAPRLGRFAVLEDASGNRYTYAGLAATASVYPWPRDRWLGLRSREGSRLGVPRIRLFAHPYRPNALKAGGLEQILEAGAAAKGFEVYTNPYLRGFGRDARGARLKPLGPGAHVVEGTVIGRVGRPRPGRAAHLRFGIRPAGRHARAIDPKPILDGWRLLELTALYRVPGALGRYGSMAQLLLMPDELLARRILGDSRIAIYPCGRQDVQAGRIDRRVLVTLAYLADSGLRPTVTSLLCGHSYLTSSGNVSHHSAGAAADISALNGVPVLGHQNRGGITERAVRTLMALRGEMRPAQIISLLALGANTLSMRDHYDHIHVGFGPAAHGGGGFVRQPGASLAADQWKDLVQRLRAIRTPRIRGGA